MLNRSVVAVALVALSQPAWSGTLVPNSQRYANRKPSAATGQSGNAVASVTALLDKQGQTVLTVEASRADGGTAGNITKLQLKGFNADENVAWTKNFTGLSGATQRLTLSGFGRGQPIHTQANIRAIDGNRTDIVTTSGVVKLLPDLAVSQLTYGGTALGADTFITATIRERNGDMGARATCVLHVDGVEVDRTEGIWIEPGSTVDCAFTHVFSSPGSKQLEVAVIDVDPGDFDSTNNRSAITLLVEDPSPTAFNWYLNVTKYRDDTTTLNRGWFEATNHSEGSDYELAQTVHSELQLAEMFGVQATVVTFPLSIRATGIADGQLIRDLQLADMPVTFDHSFGDNLLQMFFYSDPTTGVGFVVRTSRFDGIESTFIHTGFSSTRSTYFSRGYSRVWFDYHGEEYFTSLDGSGEDIGSPPWPMTSTFEGSWSVVDATGKTLAVSASVSLQPFHDEFHEPYTCSNYDDESFFRTECFSLDQVRDGLSGSTSGISYP
jgi:hypothetical protein